VLLSGGLDSILAARLLMEQGIEVTGISFESPFFTSERARRAADALGIKLVSIDITPDILRLVEEPKYGFGKNVNPCIDCHAAMVRRASELMDELGASFVATGEVVGQRPKSQMRYGLGLPWSARPVSRADCSDLCPPSCSIPRCPSVRAGSIERSSSVSTAGPASPRWIWRSASG
jgi:tRNA U34 2-thiouridine synthase MnmA/TrmU